MLGREDDFEGVPLLLYSRWQRCGVAVVSERSMRRSINSLSLLVIAHSLVFARVVVVIVDRRISGVCFCAGSSLYRVDDRFAQSVWLMQDAVIY